MRRGGGLQAARARGGHGSVHLDPGIMTGAGVIAGTAGYIAPEQFGGQPADMRIRPLAVGAVLYEAIAGCRAFSGATVVEDQSALLPGPAAAPCVGASPGDWTWSWRGHWIAIQPDATPRPVRSWRS